MINLLPTNEKGDVSYARRNTHLRRWILIVMIVTLGIVGVTGAGWLYIGRSINSYNSLVAQSQEAIRVGKLEDVQKKAENISSSIKLILQVLSKQVLFSELIRQIGRSMPDGSALTGIEISKTTGGLDLSAVAKDYKTATLVQVNMQDPQNKLFEKADIVSVSCNNDTTGGQLSCSVNVRALFGANNPYLFINQKGLKQ